MCRVVLMCGPSGSGKTTVARRLEAGGMERLSFDLLAWEEGCPGPDVPAAAIARIDARLRARLRTLLREGRDVVLDFSFATRELREEWRALAHEHGAVTETIYLEAPRATCLARVRARTGAHADDVVLDEATAARHIDGFEAPDGDEESVRVVRT